MSAMLQLIVCHLRRHWRLNLVLGLGLTLAAALMASYPIYREAIGTRSLQTLLSSYRAPPARNIHVSAGEGARLDEAVYDLVEDKLGGVLVERIDVRQIKLPLPEMSREGGEPILPAQFHFVRLWAFEDLDQKVRVVEGRLPVYEGPPTRSDPLSPPMLEVAVGIDGIEPCTGAARFVGHKSDDRLAFRAEREKTVGGCVGNRLQAVQGTVDLRRIERRRRLREGNLGHTGRGRQMTTTS